jgi:hypothetical protein
LDAPLSFPQLLTKFNLLIFPSSEDSFFLLLLLLLLFSPSYKRSFAVSWL